MPILSILSKFVNQPASKEQTMYGEVEDGWDPVGAREVALGLACDVLAPCMVNPAAAEIVEFAEAFYQFLKGEKK